jgi:hypothetical protein
MRRWVFFDESLMQASFCWRSQQPNLQDVPICTRLVEPGQKSGGLLNQSIVPAKLLLGFSLANYHFPGFSGTRSRQWTRLRQAAPRPHPANR